LADDAARAGQAGARDALSRRRVTPPNASRLETECLSSAHRQQGRRDIALLVTGLYLGPLTRLADDGQLGAAAQARQPLRLGIGTGAEDGALHADGGTAACSLNELERAGTRAFGESQGRSRLGRGKGEAQNRSGRHRRVESHLFLRRVWGETPVVRFNL